MYLFRWSLDDGTFFQEAGTQDGERGEKVSGQYSFQTPDGQIHWVTYTADDHGFHPIVGKFFFFFLFFFPKSIFM